MPARNTIAGRLDRYAPGLLVMTATTVVLWIGPKALQTVEDARVNAIVKAAKQELGQDDILARVNRASQNIISAVEPSVVDIRTATADGVKLNGSGWIYSIAKETKSTGYVLTNAHVIENAEQITVTFSDGSQRPAEFVNADSATDIAVLRVQKTRPELLRPAEQMPANETVQQGDKVYAFGSPYNLKFSVTDGMVSGVARDNRDNRGTRYTGHIQTSAAINPGNSGGPLVDIFGRVVGMNTSMQTDDDRRGTGIGFAIPIQTIVSVADQLISGGRVIRGLLGIQAMTDIAEASPGRIPPSYTGGGRGILVQELAPGGPAANAGLRPGDIIMGVDGAPVRNISSFRAKTENRKPGQRVQLTVWSPGFNQPRSLTAILEKGYLTSTGEIRPIDIDPTIAYGARAGDNAHEAVARALDNFGIGELAESGGRGATLALLRQDSPATRTNLKQGLVVTGVLDQQRTQSNGRGFIETRTRRDLLDVLARTTRTPSQREDGTHAFLFRLEDPTKRSSLGFETSQVRLKFDLQEDAATPGRP